MGDTKPPCHVAHASVALPGVSIAHLGGDKALVLCPRAWGPACKRPIDRPGASAHNDHREGEPEKQAGNAAVRVEQPSQHEAYPPSSSLCVLLATAGLVLGLRRTALRCVALRALPTRPRPETHAPERAPVSSQR